MELSMNEELTQRVAQAVRRAAMKRTVLPYRRFHEICGPDVPYAQRYALLERALTTLCDMHALDYGVLLALDNGLPGDDYFRRYLKHRRPEYVAVVGDPMMVRQSVKKKWMLVRAERERAYADMLQRLAAATAVTA
jgi:hypothetical protein